VSDFVAVDRKCQFLPISENRKQGNKKAEKQKAGVTVNQKA
jgi:hypothetical protein